jgi:hypothetical protein
MNEKVKDNEITNKTIEELKISIFKKIEELNPDKHEIYEDIFEKSVKNKCKSRHVEYYLELCEQYEHELRIEDKNMFDSDED